MNIKYWDVKTVLGDMLIAYNGDELVALELNKKNEDKLLVWLNDNFNKVEKKKEDIYFTDQLDRYLKGEKIKFTYPIFMQGTKFQKNVWSELLNIPYGEVRSYGYIAEKIGNSKAMRAVGMANGKNPIPIVIPCHRVIGKDGKLVGYSGGLEYKIELLELEGHKIKYSRNGIAYIDG
ncbi:methylated-DNA--[protein]-cysteine S-methyltransferase [Clostridiisalibacter paucivorans]|uniref:methylated-DNA--[protein]-cysteine S-methyltransferase n=1 Tax=Clostridiisalibacter paucivorans TaxID=408753 RepID=UPI000A864A02|nr:methylated-DNA--[protein]-cysteine S-methyltransferase [Clostridiisalibacter paucivorans]